jgi:hypothetical protein
MNIRDGEERKRPKAVQPDILKGVLQKRAYTLFVIIILKSLTGIHKNIWNFWKPLQGYLKV